MAEEGGITVVMSPGDDHISFQVSSYNDYDKLDQYLKYAFCEFKNFTVDEAFFNDILKLYKRLLKNSMTKEPHERLTEVRNQAVFGRPCVTEQIAALNAVTFE